LYHRYKNEHTTALVEAAPLPGEAQGGEAGARKQIWLGSAGVVLIAGAHALRRLLGAVARGLGNQAAQERFIPGMA
jgi:hypothetical protein